jgi:hypothetical protein
LPVSLGCFCFLCLRLVYPILPVSLDYFCFHYLRLVYPILPVSQSRETGNIGYTRRR